MNFPRLISTSLLALVVMAPCAFSQAKKNKVPRDMAEILARMDETAKDLKTFSANLEYTKVTVIVDDKATETGRLFYRKGKNPDILINFQKPDPRIVLFRKNKAEIYYPKINQILEYDLGQQTGLMQYFLSLGFGTETGDLKKLYDIRLVGEDELDGDTTAVLELTPRKEAIAAHLSKVELWISEESWLPAQQKFFEPGGDYVIARYTAVKVNRQISASTFRIVPAAGVKRVKMS